MWISGTWKTFKRSLLGCVGGCGGLGFGFADHPVTLSGTIGCIGHGLNCAAHSTCIRIQSISDRSKEHHTRDQPVHHIHPCPKGDDLRKEGTKSGSAVFVITRRRVVEVLPLAAMASILAIDNDA